MYFVFFAWAKRHWRETRQSKHRTVTKAEGEPSHKYVKNITFLQPAQISDTLNNTAELALNLDTYWKQAGL
jgi:hypothetical protein